MTERDRNDEAKAKADGYLNVVTQMGSVRDKSTGTLFESDRYLGWEELSLLYEQDALAARIVRRVVDDATRTKFRLVGTDASVDWASVQSELDDHETIQRLGEAWVWARLYGGALVVMGIDDGRPYSEPVDWHNVRRLNSLSVIDSTNVMPVGFVPGLGSRAFSEPEQYEIVVPWGGKSDPAGNQRLIHKSRAVRFDGVSVPASRMIINGGWGPGVLQQVWRPLRRLGSAEASAENLLHEISVMVLRITGLKEMLCGGPGSEDKVRQLLENLKWSMDNLHLLGLDMDDELAEVKRSVDGVDRLLTQFEAAVARNTDYPRMLLFGEHPGGLNAAAAGQTEIRGYYDQVASLQQSYLAPRIDRVLAVVFASRRLRGETVPAEWTIEFDPLYRETRETMAASALSWAQAMETWVLNGIVSPDEARRQLIDMGYVEALDAGEVASPEEVAEDPTVFASPVESMFVPEPGEPGET